MELAVDRNLGLAPQLSKERLKVCLRAYHLKLLRNSLQNMVASNHRTHFITINLQAKDRLINGDIFQKIIDARFVKINLAELRNEVRTCVSKMLVIKKRR